VRDSDLEFAKWIAIGAGAFLAWQAKTWMTARKNWREAQARGLTLRPPLFMEGPASLTADLVQLVPPLLQMLAGGAWAFFSIIFVGFPLGWAYGVVAGIAGGLVVAVAGYALGIATVKTLVLRQRAEREREILLHLAARERDEGGPTTRGSRDSGLKGGR